MPVSMPSIGWEEIDPPFDLGISSARSEGGLVITSRHADPFLKGTLTTGKLNWQDHADFKAFLIQCEDLNQKIDFVHPRFAVPRTYTAATLPFAGTATVTAITDLRNVVMQGLTVGLELKRGDLFTFVQGNYRAARFIGQDTTVTSDISQAITFTPRLPIGVFAANCTAGFLNPVMRFMVKPGTIRAPERYGPMRITFDFSEALA